MRLVPLAVVSALAAFAAESSSVSDAVARVEERAARLAPALASQFRAIAARDLQRRHPDLARKLRAVKAPPTSDAGTKPGPVRAEGAAVLAIERRMSSLRRQSVDVDRGRLIVQLASEIQALPPAAPGKLRLAQVLCFFATVGDPGQEPLTAATGALVAALQQSPGNATAYLDLASLIRYEHVAAPSPGPALDAADAVLALRHTLAQEADFTLTSLDGATYTLSALKGQVVLVNFWTTSCPPCRREMPDIEKLYRALKSEGFIVLAISDEERADVAVYIRNERYTFPVLLDPDRKAHNAFGGDGIPRSYLFDRGGKLTAVAIGIRSERQFREMLESAGLKVGSK